MSRGKPSAASHVSSSAPKIEPGLHLLTMESMQKYDANMPRSLSSVGGNIFNDYHNNIFASNQF